MSQTPGRRLAPHPQQPLAFTFDGKPLTGARGDTLASALIAAGIDVVGRSFKLGRPRGIVGYGAEEPNAIVDAGGGAGLTPNLRATEVELFDGLEAAPAARGPGLPLGGLGRFLGAGFYYKTFMRPRRLWPLWERLLRRTAGLGDAPDTADADRYDRRNGHCDVLVVGAGAAGLAAALAAARAGARVTLVDQDREFGGALLASRLAIAGEPAARWIERAVAELAAADVELLARSTAFGLYDHNFVTVLERRTDHLAPSARSGPQHRLHRIRARQVVLATGAIERPVVFAGNDVPGVMLASAVSAYLHRHRVAAGRRLLLFACNDGAYATALDWRAEGLDVAGVVDPRPSPAGELPKRAAAAGIDIVGGHAIAHAFGGRRVREALAVPVGGGPGRRIGCDLIAVAGGWSPAIHLAAQTGVRPRWSDVHGAFLPGDAGDAIRCAGAAAGAGGAGECLRGGAEAGARAAAAAGFGSGRPGLDVPATDEPGEEAPASVFRVPHPTRDVTTRQFVDLQLDVTVADIELAAREGFHAVEHVKRYTALGFGTDQGKLGNVNGVAILAAALGRDVASTGTTMFRPPYTPVAFGAMAGANVGERFDATRRTPMHDWHGRRGAVWEDVGRWKRPRYYPRPGESMQTALARECRAARRGAALLDASTLGKIDVQGRDAAVFLDRIYATGFRRLAPGRCRYGLMLAEDGAIFDDGVTVRLGEERFLVHTTTGNAEAVLAWMELWLQTEWPELDVRLTSVTDHWATAALAGPRARAVLGRVCEDIDLSAGAFRFMDCREGTVAGAPARVFRISFSGALCFEINVAAQHGERLWEALMAAGAEFDITPYGTEAMHVLRAERGFIMVGQDTDGTMTPDDMGLEGAVRHGKAFGFLGDRSLALPDHRRPDRLQFVGLEPLEPAALAPEGAQLTSSPRPARPAEGEGHVTSSYRSPVLGRSIALGMVRGGRRRHGETLYCLPSDGRVIGVRIVDPVFHVPDPAEADGDPCAGAAPQALPPLAAAPEALLNVRGDAADGRFRDAVAETAGTPPPADPCTFSRGAQGTVYWLGPDEWLLRRPGSGADLERRLRDLAGAHVRAVTDVTGAFVGIRLEGANARDVLRASTPYDVHPRAFPPGRCARTVFARTEALIAADSHDAFDLLVRRSYARYVEEWVADVSA